MRSKRFFWLPMGAAIGLLFAACAPVGQAPIADSAKETHPEGHGTVEMLPAPAPVVSGPKGRLEAAIETIRRRDLLTTHGFWTVFHGILGLGPSLKLRHPETGERINALEYICDGGEMRGLGFLPTKHGLDVPIAKDGLGVGQGHQDQFVAEMGQWGMPAERKIVVYGKEYTFMDFVRQSQMRASTSKMRNQELSWAIIVVGQYIGQDVSWTNQFGEKLHYEDMIRYELDSSVENAACGGTHRLFGLSWSYHLHRLNGGKTDGVWKEIAEKTAKYRDLAKKHQNADGALSTDYFKGPGNNPDKSARISTTGHMVEWLSLALSDDELKEPWMQEAVNALALLVLDLEGSPVEGGTIYHAAHGLLMYYARVYGRDWLGPNDPLIPLPPELKSKKES